MPAAISAAERADRADRARRLHREGVLDAVAAGRAGGLARAARLRAARESPDEVDHFSSMTRQELDHAVRGAARDLSTHGLAALARDDGAEAKELLEFLDEVAAQT